MACETSYLQVAEVFNQIIMTKMCLPVDWNSPIYVTLLHHYHLSLGLSGPQNEE